MWPVLDKVGVVVAKTFWRFFDHFILDGEDYDSGLVAKALNTAITVAASENILEPLSWAGFIHIGGKFRQIAE